MKRASFPLNRIASVGQYFALPPTSCFHHCCPKEPLHEFPLIGSFVQRIQFPLVLVIESRTNVVSGNGLRKMVATVLRPGIIIPRERMVKAICVSRQTSRERRILNGNGAVRAQCFHERKGSSVRKPENVRRRITGPIAESIDACCQQPPACAVENATVVRNHLRLV